VALQLNIYSRRWDHHDRYSVEHTDDGWVIEHMTKDKGPCNPRGEPYLFEHLTHDSINYPVDLGGYMEWLWRQARERNMSEPVIQECLDVLAGWIETVEKASPRGLWLGYNSGRADRDR